MAYGQGSFNGTTFTYESQATHDNSVASEEMTTLSSKKVLFIGAPAMARWSVRVTLKLAEYATLLGFAEAKTSGTLTTEVGHTCTALILGFSMVENAGPDELSANMHFIKLS